MARGWDQSFAVRGPEETARCRVTAPRARRSAYQAILAKARTAAGGLGSRTGANRPSPANTERRTGVSGTLITGLPVRSITSAM